MKKKVLLVDDHQVNRAMLANMLGAEYDVLEAENGEVALQILRETDDISAMLLDLMMPVMDGYQVLEELEKSAVLANLPVIVTTSSKEDNAELKALELGAQDYISKPYHPEILRLRLEHLIKRAEATSRSGNQEEKNNMRYTDYLTKTYNRAGFYHALEMLIQQNPSQHFTLVCCNIRNFKAVNELYGAKVGDQLLKKICAGILRQKPLLCGRIDADRFMICLNRANLDIDVLVSYSKNTFETDSISFSYMLRFGVYLVKDNTMPVNAMCDRAKAAIKYIRDEFFIPYAIWDESMREEIVNQGIFANDLLPALEQKEFEVYYQPIVDAKTQKIASAEALIRWHHPTMGFIPPSKFIPVFEKNASIAKLDGFVGDSVAAFVKSRLTKNAHVVPISVNTSRMDYHNFNIGHRVGEVLDQIALPPQYFRLEITESTYAMEPEKIFEDVRRIKGYGIQILLDDFGSGYSSFNSLQDIDVDIIKMDMRFVKGFPENERCKIIMRSVIEMAHKLGSQVVAEGVETKEQYEFIRDADCDFIQGYYFYKPMSKADFEKCLDAEQENAARS